MLRILMIFIAVAFCSDAARAGGRYLIRFSPTISEGAARDTLNRNGFQAVRQFPEIDVFVADSVGASGDESSRVRGLRASPDVLYVEPNQMRFTRLVPNDPRYSEQDGLKRMEPELAWNVTTGSANIIVGVSDTGVDMAHADLKGQIWRNPGEVAANGRDDDGNGYVDDVSGWDFYANDNDPRDENRHGTHVGGITGAEGNNAVGVVGANWDVTLMPVRFLSASGSGTDEGGIATILYAVRNGARLVNASWGGGGDSTALRDAIQYAYENGALLIAAAGNDSADSDRTPHYPSASPGLGVISVASSQGDGSLSSFSNWGLTTVDVVAPGSNVLSTLPDGQYGRLSGTSMATPMVSGVAALILAREPGLSAQELRNALLNSVVERSQYKGLIATSGDLSARRAVEQLSEGFQVWPGRYTVAVGAQYPFTAYDAQGGVTWAVNDPGVASIDANGVLRGLKEGEVDVTATDSSGRRASTQWVRIARPGGGKNPPPALPGCLPPPTANAGRNLDSTQASAAAFSMGLPLLVGFFVRARARRAASRQRP